MEWREAYANIIRLNTEILEIEAEKRMELIQLGQIDESDERIRYEYLDLNEFYEQFKNIMLPILDNYKKVSNNETKKILYRVYAAALCEMMKHDYNRGMLLTFKAVTGNDEIDVNRYYDLIKEASKSEGIKIYIEGNKNQYENSFIIESGIPKKLFSEILDMFKIYWRYFRRADEKIRNEFLEDFLGYVDIEKPIINDPRDYELLCRIREVVYEFPQKVIYTIRRFERIFTEIDNHNYNIDIMADSFQEICHNISKRVGFNILNVLRTKELEKIYMMYIRNVTVVKFKKLLLNLNRTEIVTLPNGSTVAVGSNELLNIWCGIYLIRNVEYHVIIDPSIDLDHMLSLPVNKLFNISDNYYFYSSNQSFDIEIEYQIISSRFMMYKGRCLYVWIGKIPPATVAYIDGEKIQSSDMYDLICGVRRYFNYETRKNELVINISKFKLLNQEASLKQIEINTLLSTDIIEGIADNRGSLYLENKIIHLKEFKNQIVINVLMDKKKIGDKIIEFEDIYLYGKYSGLRYKRNTKYQHEGEFVCFSNIEFYSESNIVIEEQYEFNSYYITVFSTEIGMRKIDICGVTWFFNISNNPFLLLNMDNISLDFIAKKIKDVKFKIKNASINDSYYLIIENENKSLLKTLNADDISEELIFERLVSEANEFQVKTGKWFVSLWKSQKKISEITFIIAPTLKVIQTNKVVLEGNDVLAQVSADVPCFEKCSGEITDTIDINMGKAELEIIDSFITSKKVFSSVYNTLLNVSQDIELQPKVWGIRVKNYNNNEWTTDENIILDSFKGRSKGLYLCSLVPFIADINFGLLEKSINPGINNLHVYDIFEKYERDNKINICYGKENINFSINIKGQINQISQEIINETLVLKYFFYGPIKEIFTIRAFVEEIKIAEITKEAFNNQFHITFIIDEICRYSEKEIIIEYSSNFQIQPYVISKISAVKMQNTNTINKSNTQLKLQEFLLVKNILSYYNKNYISKKEVCFHFKEVKRIISDMRMGLKNE